MSLNVIKLYMAMHNLIVLNAFELFQFIDVIHFTEFNQITM